MQAATPPVHERELRSAVLGAVRELGCVCAHDLATRIQDPSEPSQMLKVDVATQMLEHLVASGLLKRRASPQDGRSFTGPRQVYELAV